jgi:hypothetical protein
MLDVWGVDYKKGYLDDKWIAEHFLGPNDIYHRFIVEVLAHLRQIETW